MFSYRYNSALLPEKGNILNYWIRISKPVFRKMLFPILLQTGFAAYLGSRQYKLLIKALQLQKKKKKERTLGNTVPAELRWLTSQSSRETARAICTLLLKPSAKQNETLQFSKQETMGKMYHLFSDEFFSPKIYISWGQV